MTTPYAWAIGVDPGATTGIALVRSGGAGKRATCSHVYSTRATGYRLAEEIRGIVYGVMDAPRGVVVIERVAGVAFSAKGAGIVPHLVAAAELAGIVYGVLRAVDLCAVRLASAREWRHAVVGDPAATDQKIAARLPLACVYPRTNAHGRDAIGAACFGLRGGGSAG